MAKKVWKGLMLLGLISGLIFTTLADLYAKGPRGGGQGQGNMTRQRIHTPGTGQTSEPIKQQKRQRIHAPDKNQQTPAPAPSAGENQ
ncbi:MAG: hypothetical protein ACP5KO_06625 [Caldimicrobium sp.]|jgi:hypothetical protein|uniref:Uncharacterized protein n=1 Tax=Caldimicrobium thiodismutans TaxID=1653476 RepID=A0A2N7PL68_9BACT|nr:MAG: hypothetical protein C0197_00980 [Caldimicrobium thiodismutans]